MLRHAPMLTGAYVTRRLPVVSYRRNTTLNPLLMYLRNCVLWHALSA